MNQKLVLLLLLSLALSQVVMQLPKTLKDLSKTAAPLDTLQAKAINYLLQTHPQLSNYTVTNISTQINRTNQNYASNIKDFLFELNLTNIRIRALVSLSTQNKESYVTLSPIVSYSPPPPKTKNNYFAEYSIFLASPNKGEPVSNSIINQPISSDNISAASDGNSKPTSKRPPPNSFIAYQDLNDPLVQFALDYVASLHPNIINYQIQKAFYQIVAGLNIKLNYLGYDSYSTISAVVNFDLKLNPKLIAFEVGCVKYDDYCNPLAVWNIYQSIESILMFHPQLFAYKIEDFLVQNKITPGNGVKVMLTFDNSAKKLRTLIQSEININKATVLSFYTYSYEQ